MPNQTDDFTPLEDETIQTVNDAKKAQLVIDDNGDIEFTVNLDQIDREVLRSCFSVAYFSLNRLIEAVLNGTEDEQQAAFKTAFEARDHIALKLYEKVEESA